MTTSFEKYKKQLDKLNLKTVKDLENLVKPLIKEATRIIPQKTSKMPKETSLLSHFGGQPYFEKGEKWPTSKDKNCLEFVFQIFNTGNIHLPDNIKLVQFYYDFEKCPWETSNDGWLVKIYESIDKDKIAVLEKPKEHTTVKYCEIQYKAIKSLPDWNGIESYDKSAEMLSCVLDEEEPWMIYQKVVETLIGNQDIKSKTYRRPMVDPQASADNFSVIWQEFQVFENKISQLGGYAYWVQNDDSPKNKDFHLLFQIASEDNAGVIWGDAGLVYVFYNPTSKKIEFVSQCG